MLVSPEGRFVQKLYLVEVYAVMWPPILSQDVKVLTDEYR